MLSRCVTPRGVYRYFTCAGCFARGDGQFRYDACLCFAMMLLIGDIRHTSAFALSLLSIMPDFTAAGHA